MYIHWFPSFTLFNRGNKTHIDEGKDEIKEMLHLILSWPAETKYGEKIQVSGAAEKMCAWFSLSF